MKGDESGKHGEEAGTMARVVALVPTWARVAYTAVRSFALVGTMWKGSAARARRRSILLLVLAIGTLCVVHDEILVMIQAVLILVGTEAPPIIIAAALLLMFVTLVILCKEVGRGHEEEDLGTTRAVCFIFHQNILTILPSFSL